MGDTPLYYPGDRVYVDDPGLAELRRIMQAATGKAAPNHHGTVDEVHDDGTIIIIFDGPEGPATSNAAPYPSDDVHPLPPEQEEPT